MNLGRLGIECGSGWYPIIETAAREIEDELCTMWRAQSQNPESLAAMDEALLSRKFFVYPALPFCADIRSVSGALLIEVTQGFLCDIDAWGPIHESLQRAVAKAGCTCESCGKPGRFRKSYWQHVYCDECAAPFDIESPS